MGDSITLPTVGCKPRGKKGYEAIAALALTSVMSADLLLGHDQAAGDEQSGSATVQFQSQEALLQAVSGWPSHTVLELHWCAVPDLQHTAQGVLWITLFLRSRSNGREDAMARVIQGYFRLHALLRTHFRHLTFAPVRDRAVLDQRFSPFESKHALSVGRKHRRIALSDPIQRSTLGFGRLERVGGQAEMVDHRYPWLPALHAEELFGQALMARMDPVKLVVRVRPKVPSAARLEPLAEAIDTCEQFLSAGRRYQITLTQQASMIRDTCLVQLARLNECGLEAGLFFFSPSALDAATVNALAQLVLVGVSNSSGSPIFRGGFSVEKISASKALKMDCLPEKPVTVSEAAVVFHLPKPPLNAVSGLPVRRWRTAPATIRLQSDGAGESTHFFDNDHHGQVQPIFLGDEDRLRHMFLCGQTGCGKSTFMEHLILQDIEQGRGVAVIDPHGDMVESLLGRIGDRRAEDVVLFDVLDREMPMGFNLLQWKTMDERDLIIDEIYQSLDMMYDMKRTGGPIFEANFRNVLKLLMGDGRDTRGDFVPTVVDFLRCYLDDDFREWLVSTIDDDEVVNFIKELERPTCGDIQLRNVAPYVTSKFGRFTNDITLKRVFGQSHTSFDFDEILNEQKILLVKLGRGRFGSSVCGLLTSQLLLKIKLAAMQRGDLAVNDRKDFFLYVDEAGLVPGHSLGELLSEARKFRLGVVLASQYTKQLTHAVAAGRKDTLLNSIHGNVGTTVIFRLGKEDAKEMSSHFWPEFSTLDIMRLPNFCGYAKMQTGSQPSPPFSFRTRPISAERINSQAEKIRVRSAFLYGTPVADVDDQIRDRSNVWQ